MFTDAFGTAREKVLLVSEPRAGSRPGQLVLRFSGPVDLETVPKFLRAVRAESAPAVILDLTGVPFIDSAGIGALIQIHFAFQKASRRLALAGVNQRVTDVLELMRLKKVFVIFPTLAEAESHLG